MKNYLDPDFWVINMKNIFYESFTIPFVSIKISTNFSLILFCYALYWNFFWREISNFLHCYGYDCIKLRVTE